MGAPAQISPLEALVMERVLAHVLERAVPKLSGPVVIEFPQPTYPMDDDAIDDLGEPIASDTDDSGPALDSEPVPGTGQPLEVMRSLAEERARVEARMVTVAKDVLAATGAALLADKGFTSVSELSATATKKWRAEAKATAVAEIQLLLGIGVMAGRRLVGLAAAPPRTQSTVVAALARGEASLDMALRFWERCGSLPDEDGAEVADALFGTDPAIAAEERLDPEGGLRMGRPWHHGEYDAALEREALRRQARDADARREQRRRAREE